MFWSISEYLKYFCICRTYYLWMYTQRYYVRKFKKVFELQKVFLLNTKCFSKYKVCSTYFKYLIFKESIWKQKYYEYYFKRVKSFFQNTKYGILFLKSISNTFIFNLQIYLHLRKSMFLKSIWNTSGACGWARCCLPWAATKNGPSPHTLMPATFVSFRW